MRIVLTTLAILLTCVQANARHLRVNPATPPQSMFSFLNSLAQPSSPASGRIVAHPQGCPHRNFCGCGLSVHFFGHPIPSLFRAATWAKVFERTSPAPGMAAVRRGGGHVFGLIRHVQGLTWVVYDANSGRHKTRIHQRSIAGYRIVDPHIRRTRYAFN